jgi:hypothetical protein
MANDARSHELLGFALEEMPGELSTEVGQPAIEGLRALGVNP